MCFLCKWCDDKIHSLKYVNLSFKLNDYITLHVIKPVIYVYTLQCLRHSFWSNLGLSILPQDTLTSARDGIEPLTIPLEEPHFPPEPLLPQY